MWRSKIIFLILLVWYLVVIARLFNWQVLSSDRLSQEAEKQHFISLSLPAIRGDILSADDSMLVINQPAYLVFAEPNKITDKKKVISRLSNILDLPIASISAKLVNDKALWVPIARKIDQEIVDKLSQENLGGIGFEKEGKRFYPEASMSAQLLGFVAFDVSGQDKGYFGLEGYYDRELKGKPGFLRQEKDPQGAPIVVGKVERVESENGRNIKLHIDKMVQTIVEDKLKKGIETYGAKSGIVIVMEPNTGAILSMSSFPSYDPAKYFQFSNNEFKNPVISDVFEPGSTFKSLVMAAALNEGVVKPNTEVDEGGPARVGGYDIRTWDDKYRQKINMTQILEYSSNVGMVRVGDLLGKEKLVNYLHLFGFGELTNIDLEGETTAEIKDSKSWYDIDYATVTFGQGIAVTPIQMVRAAAALANGGKLVEPHVVDQIIDASGKTVTIKPKVIRTVLKQTTSRLITEMLISSVNHGEAHYKLPKGFRIAGKTGTAQIPIKGHYDDKKTIASFIGYAPADNPKFVMLVALTEPTSSPWGSETAAPLFMDIAKDLLAYYRIFPG